MTHDDVIKWKHFPRYWPFVRGIHRSPVNSPHKGQWRGALIFSLICVRINGWVNNRDAGDLRRHHSHYDVTVMIVCIITFIRITIFLLTSSNFEFNKAYFYWFLAILSTKLMPRHLADFSEVLRIYKETCVKTYSQYCQNDNLWWWNFCHYDMSVSAWS